MPAMTLPVQGVLGAATLLRVDDLHVEFESEAGGITAVDGLSIRMERGETLALVGESGSGKSVTALALMGLLPRPNARVTGGAIHFDGKDLSSYSDSQMRQLRGRDIGMVFQEPMTSLNPVLTVGAQISEKLRMHAGLTPAQANGRTVELLDLVRIPEPRQRARHFPHQMSGGMRQRVMIAMALACGPKLLIADEPTTALDVTIQAQILDLLRSLKSEFGMAILFITHDLGVVAEMADNVVVMYAGRAVEQATVHAIFASPRMPYTRALLRCIPRVDRTGTTRQRLQGISGNVPNAMDLLPGCAFHPRCSEGEAPCAAAIPELEDIGDGHLVRCRRWRELGDAQHAGRGAA
jgi:oligopeptide/dipeptide ABC transporter ATP-binding protein